MNVIGLEKNNHKKIKTITLQLFLESGDPMQCHATASDSGYYTTVYNLISNKITIFHKAISLPQMSVSQIFRFSFKSDMHTLKRGVRRLITTLFLASFFSILFVS